MAAAGTSSVLVADVRSTAQPVDEIKEYEKILKISDEIFAGTHPRLKVPQQFVRKVPSRIVQSSVAPAVIENAGSQQSKTTPAETSSAESRGSQTQTRSSVASPASALSSVAPKSASGIDPIFLTKSDDLVRAEIQLQRKRIENTLKEQVERSKAEARQKIATLEGRPDFDVSEILNQALEIVKPLPSPDVPGTNDATIPSDSVDENSLYSSRAPDSPLTWDYEKQIPELDRYADGRAEKTAPNVDERRVADTRSHTMQSTTDTAILAQARNQPVPAQRKQPQPHPHPHPLQQQQQDEPLQDEPEYSPPEPTVPVVENRGDDEYQPPEILNSTRHNTLGGVNKVLPQQSPISPDIRVVRNHITSPAAPQPSRVSPLATAKNPSVQGMLHTRSGQHDYVERVPSVVYSRQMTPEGSAQQQLLPRKRRRVQEPRDRFELRPIDTPEPRIKLEPVSPPPFHDATSRGYQTLERPVYIDVSSPRYASLVDRREVISREPIYDLDRHGSNVRDYGTPTEASVRATSRVSTRRVRDSQDLRRVASLHNARNPDNATREFIEPVLRPQSARASPFAVVERQPIEKTAYYEDAVPAYSRRYMQYEDYPSSSRYREYYVDEAATPRYVEPAPARRIVMDEYGNQYYEMVPASKIRPVAPVPARVVRPDDYSDRAYIRSASVRAPSIVEDGYGNRRYIQEMAPPSGNYRRVAEHGRTVTDSQRLYQTRPVADRESVLRSGSVAVDYVPRQATYVEEDIPHERLVRTSSVRPPSSRYEQHREGLQRVQSVRPSGREVSIYVDENGHHVAREFNERPEFTAIRPERESRYITEEDGTRLAVEGARDIVHRVAPRY